MRYWLFRRTYSNAFLAAFAGLTVIANSHALPGWLIIVIALLLGLANTITAEE